MFTRKYEKPEDLLKKGEEYFETTPIKEQTRAGLCVFLNITTESLRKYRSGDYGEGFTEVIDWMYTRLEHKYEVELNFKSNPTGPIFALKQYGWKDNQDVEVKGTGQISIVTNIPRPEEG